MGFSATSRPFSRTLCRVKSTVMFRKLKTFFAFPVPVRQHHIHQRQVPRLSALFLQKLQDLPPRIQRPGLISPNPQVHAD